LVLIQVVQGGVSAFIHDIGDNNTNEIGTSAVVPEIRSDRRARVLRGRCYRTTQTLPALQSMGHVDGPATLCDPFLVRVHNTDTYLR
jgi:hypothetical protein